MDQIIIKRTKQKKAMGPPIPVRLSEMEKGLLRDFMDEYDMNRSDAIRECICIGHLVLTQQREAEKMNPPTQEPTDDKNTE